MSAVKDDFYTLFVPRMTALGFDYKKSKNAFIKIENGLSYTLNMRWDGRGGLTLIDHITGDINSVVIAQAVKKLVGNWSFPHFSFGFEGPSIAATHIPVMYSRAALDLANAMNFNALAKIPYDQKYPPNRILNCVNVTEAYVQNTLSPIMDTIKSEADIYQTLCKRVEEATTAAEIWYATAFLTKLYAHKLKLPLPPLLEGYTDYIRQFKEGFPDQNPAMYDALETNIANYRFDS
jgi:hypothetical protein